MKKKINFWDIDHTIINNDCDLSWKQFLIEKKIADKQETEEKSQFFFEQYQNNKLDWEEFLKFQLREFCLLGKRKILKLSQEHFIMKVKEKIYPQAKKMIELQQENEIVCLITSTNEFLAYPIAKELKIEHLIGTKLEINKENFTGNIIGDYCLGINKVSAMKRFCKEKNLPFTNIAYYGDSTADISIMRKVNFPCAINPNEKLRIEAKKKNWIIIDFEN